VREARSEPEGGRVMEPRFTPGPLRVTVDAGDWTASYDGLGISEYQGVCDADGTVVALVVARSRDHYAELDTNSYARLFAASPDLLAVLQEIVDADDEALAALDGIGMPPELDGPARRLTEKARAAISKSLGGSHV